MHKRENDYPLLKAFMNIYKVFLSSLISLPFWIFTAAEAAAAAVNRKAVFPLCLNRKPTWTLMPFMLRNISSDC